jgi:hypothetical protein
MRLLFCRVLEVLLSIGSHPVCTVVFAHGLEWFQLLAPSSTLLSPRLGLPALQVIFASCQVSDLVKA